MGKRGNARMKKVLSVCEFSEKILALASGFDKKVEDYGTGIFFECTSSEQKPQYRVNLWYHGNHGGYLVMTMRPIEPCQYDAALISKEVIAREFESLYTLLVAYFGEPIEPSVPEDVTRKVWTIRWQEERRAK